jgi:long-chain acyl-CoA synthetase
VPHGVYTDYLEQWASEAPDAIWLRDRSGDDVSEWSWARARAETLAVAAWLEERFGTGVSMAILSRNRAHWFLADVAIIASGNVAIPIFTTIPAPAARYVLDFSRTRLLFLGEAQNQDAVRRALPEGIQIVCLPGVEIDEPHLRWEDLLAEAAGRRPRHRCRPGDTLSLVFTSGTTGVPKGVIQTHESMVIPIDRFAAGFAVRDHPRFLSYLPLSHIGERQLVEGHSLLRRGVVTFNESLATLLRDLTTVRPNFVFGPPRIWEQLQQAVLAKLGPQQALDRALSEDVDATRACVDAILGLGDSDYCLTAAAPTPPALIEWFRRVGIQLLEGYGQTEAMGLVVNTRAEFRVGSIGKALPGVEYELGDDDELLIRAPGLSPGYYEMPEKTAELHRDGWLHTGDKARVDDDGFLYLTGRVKDYFKTISGKFVAPVPIESDFADNPHTAQVCLLGRGYSKTVMICVLNEPAQRSDRAEVERALRAKAEAINASVEKHARLGALILCREAWTIENEVLTPTLKIRRERVEARFGERAESLGRAGAEQSVLLIEWD